MKANSSKLLIFVALTAFICILLWVRSTGHREPDEAKRAEGLPTSALLNQTQTPPPSLSSQPVPKPVPQLRPGALAITPGASLQDGAGSKERREKGIVEVRAVNGLAIAQGDILLGKLNQGEANVRGQAQVPEIRFWESPEIPYAIDPSINDAQKQKIEAALAYLREMTPVHFVAYTGQSDAIVFEKGSEHCISVLGKIGGLQPIRLDRECGTHEILHEILHALGFPHEQSRSDRDANVEILWTNIEEKYQDQFQMVPDVWMSALRDQPFDLESIMMYGPEIFQARPGVPTMRSLSASPIAPVSEGLSIQDRERLKRMFHSN